jgi:hypothetical protein
MRLELTPHEWEWFKRLAGDSAPVHEAPCDIRSKLVDLQLLEMTRDGRGLRATAHGRDVLRLVRGGR